MSRLKLFGGKVQPACEYCRIGVPSNDNRTIKCEKNGFVHPRYHCGGFVYDPLRRKPKRSPPLRKFCPEDFSI